MVAVFLLALTWFSLPFSVLILSYLFYVDRPFDPRLSILFYCPFLHVIWLVYSILISFGYFIS